MAGMGFSSCRISLSSWNSRAPESRSKKLLLDRVIDEVGGEFADPELETLLEADGPEDPGGVLHEAQVVEQADAPFLQVPLGPEEVQQDAELPGIELQRQGVDGRNPGGRGPS